MDRDLRDTPIYKEVEEFYRRALGPGFGRMSEAADPSPSPEAHWIAFVGSHLDDLEGLPRARVYLVRPDGSGLARATNGPNDDSNARWSPDGRTLTFQSDRAEEGRFQVYALTADSLREARPLPEVPGTVEYHSWAPHGRRIVAGVAGPGADQAGASGSGTTKAAEGLPDWVPSVESADNVEREWRRLWLFDLPDESVEEARVLSREGLNVWEASWSGPNAVVAIASESPGEEAWYAAPLVLIDLATGEERVLLRSDVQLGLPRASPSGSRVAVVEALCSDRLIVAGDIMLVDPGSGDARRIDTPGIDVTHLAWRDEERLFFVGVRGMESVAGEVDASTGAATELWSSPEACGDWYPFAAPLGENGFVTVLHSWTRPPEVVTVNTDRPGAADAVRVIASSRTSGTALMAGPSARERIAWTAPDGLEIEGLLAVPEGPAPFPLVVHVHGGPIWAYQDAWPLRSRMNAVLVSREYAVFEPNPRGSTGHGQKFAEMVVGDMGGDDVLDILAGIDALVDRGIADPKRIGVTGGSYGGFMSCWLPTRDARFKASVAISPVTDWYSQHFNSNIGHWDADFLKDRPEQPGGEYHARSPVLFADRVTTPTLLTAGSLDRCTPPGQAIEFYRALRSRGVPTEVVIYPQEGHGVQRFPAMIDLMTRVVAWFERFMPPNRPAG